MFMIGNDTQHYSAIKYMWDGVNLTDASLDRAIGLV